VPERMGEHGEGVPGPPWILGHRGVPREAPENTQASLRRAIELSLDGVEYDLQRCASGEAVLLHDETLDRTTDATGPVAERTLPELFGIDAGGWFHRDFEGEPLPLFEEVLELPGLEAGTLPQHMIELKDPALVPEVSRQLAQHGQQLSVRVASFHRSVCLEARDAGLASMLLADVATQEDRAFVRDERIAAYGTGPGGWRTPAGREAWSSERWSWSVDEPEDLLEACRIPLNAFNTNEPLRALATRALVRLAPADRGPFPVRVPELEVLPGSLEGSRGEWCGRWELEGRVRNPFAFPVAAELALEVRGGAFEAEELPQLVALAPREERAFRFALTGGSWSPGSDPVLSARYAWGPGPGRAAATLVLDAPLHRRRTLTAGEDATRLVMLRERAADRDATVAVRRRGNRLLVSVEDTGGLREPRLLVRVGRSTYRGGRGLAVSLPGDFDLLRGGVPFSVGFTGRGERGEELRRWAGGVPEGLESGVPGRLLPRALG